MRVLVVRVDWLLWLGFASGFRRASRAEMALSATTGLVGQPAVDASLDLLLEGSERVPDRPVGRVLARCRTGLDGPFRSARGLTAAWCLSAAVAFARAVSALLKRDREHPPACCREGARGRLDSRSSGGL